MTQDLVIEIINQAIYLVLIISAPILLVTLVVGLAIGIFQAVTSIQEMTLAFIPKILVSILVLVLTFPWIMNKLLDFTIYIFQHMQSVVK
jgi:flagellar biosynthesis protein FliQ